MRAFYTTPLKALSNQKFADFQRQFGEENVGLLTGDVNVRRDAPVVVMTTEVYRNMLYAGEREGSAMDDVASVTFDEFHFISSSDRGTVWEESVVNSPSHVLLVALSATMKNTAEVREWFEDVQGPTALVESSFRPVPLDFKFCQREGLLPLFAGEGRPARKGERARKGSGEKKLHPKLLAGVAETAERGRSRRGGERASREEASRGRRGRGRDEGSKDFDTVLRDYDRQKERASDRGGRRMTYKQKQAVVPSFPFVVRSLRRRDMLPAIVFIFSRIGCERAAKEAASEKEVLVSEVEAEEIGKRVDAFLAEHGDMANEERVGLVRQGIASHHAGLLPLWKAFVEELFQDGLVKVVFATETLAAGINMPCRTTCISSMSKRRGEEGIVQLSTSEVLQMAGRAGRRGKDTLGHAVLLQSPFEGPIEAFRVVTSEVDELQSHFTPSYGMVLNLLQTRTMEDARSLVERSFGAFLRRKRQAEAEAEENRSNEVREGGHVGQEHRENEMAGLRAVESEALKLLGQADEAELRNYMSAVERVKAERRALKYVERQSKETDRQLIEDTLAFAPSGTRVRLRGARTTSATPRGAYRRQKRRELTSALGTAGRGEGIEDLRALFLEESSDDDLADLNDPLDEVGDGGRSLMDGVLLDVGPDFGVSLLFAAVCDDGNLMLFTHDHVERLDFDSPVVDLDMKAPDWKSFDFPDRSNWNCIGLDQYLTPLPIELAPLVEAVRELKVDAPSDAESLTAASAAKVEKETHPEVYAQRERLRHAKSIVENHALHGADHLEAALRAKRSLAQLKALINEMEEGGSGIGKSSRRKRRKRGSQRRFESEKAPAAESAAIAKADTAEEYETEVFGEFLSIVDVLRFYGFVDSDNCVTSIGEVGAKVRTENELWASIVLMEPSLEEASPVHLAAVMAAMLADGGFRPDTYVAYQPSPEACALIEDLLPLRAKLLAVQDESGVDFPVSLELDPVGLVEAWASGDSWVDILSNTSLQEGDVCRTLRRVLDSLRQIPHIPFLSDAVKLNAKRSVSLMSRMPVVDDVSYFVRDAEKVFDPSDSENGGHDEAQT